MKIYYKSYVWDALEETLQDFIERKDMEGFKIAFMFLEEANDDNSFYRVVFEIPEA